MKLNRRTLPSGKVQWRARFVDPDTGRETDVTLDALALPSEEARRQWAITKAKAIARRRMDLEGGAERAAVKPLSDALSAYRKAAELRLRARTLVTYDRAAGRFLRWAERAGVETTAELTRARLVDLRAHLIAARRKVNKRGRKRGQPVETSARRSPVSVNVELRSIKTLLNEWRVAGLLPALDSDAIGDALKALPVAHEQPAYLGAAQLRKLLDAALRHDAATFELTRAENAGQGAKGTTPRNVPIAAFAAVLVLTGMRRGEALALTWADVDLDALDAQGRKVGEIRLAADQTKTHRARTIGLEVSPALRALLAAMKLRAGDGALHVFETRDAEGERHPYTVDLVEAARKRLQREHSAPRFDWQTLRSTCATYLTNAPAIFGAATVFLSARQLGHSVQVAEKHYLGVHRGIARDARTLESAMQIEAEVRAVKDAVASTRATRAKAVAR